MEIYACYDPRLSSVRKRKMCGSSHSTPSWRVQGLMALNLEIRSRQSNGRDCRVGFITPPYNRRSAHATAKREALPWFLFELSKQANHISKQSRARLQCPGFGDVPLERSTSSPFTTWTRPQSLTLFVHLENVLARSD